MPQQENKKGYITHRDYEKLLKNGIHGSFVFFGDEDYTKNVYIKKTAEAITKDETLSAMNVQSVSSSTENFSLSELSDAVNTLPVLCEKHMVELCGLDFMDFQCPGEIKEQRVSDIISSLCSVADATGEDAVFIVRFRSGAFDCSNLESWSRKAPSAMFGKLKESFRMVYFPCESDSDLQKWVSRHFISEGIAANPSICEKMIDYCGKNMTVLSNEIGKLCCYLKSFNRDKLEAEDIPEVCCAASEYGAFDFTNAILAKDAKRTFEILNVMKLNHEKPELILASITSQFANMLLCKSFEECGLLPDEIAKKTGLSSGQVFNLQKNMRGISKAELEKLSALCSKTDASIKNMMSDSYEAIEKMICFMI